MLSVLQSNQKKVCAEDSSTKTEELISAPSCELPCVNCDVIQVSPKVGAIKCNRDEVSPEILTCQRDYSLKRRQMQEHPNYLCDLFSDDGRYYINSYLQDECIGPIKGLIDTGSQATILSFNYFQQIVDRTEKKPKLKAFDGSLISVGGNALQVKGIAWLKFTIGKKIIRHPTIIVDIPNDKLIIGVDILKRLSSIIDFINEAIWTQVKAPIAYDRSCNMQTHYNCHVVEERSNLIEVHFRNNQIPDITILKNGDPEKAIRDTKHTITIQKDRIKKVNNMARMKYAKLDLKSEASYISLSLLKQVADPKMIRYSSPQDQWVHDLDGDSQSHNVIARCLLSISIGDKTTEHSFNVLNEPRHQMYIGNDLLHRFAAQIDLVNNNLWSRLSGDPEGFQNEEQTLKWGQQMPYAVSILVAEDVEIPEGGYNKSDLSSEEGTCHIEEASLVFNHESDEKEYELYQLKKEKEQAAEQISLADACSDESKRQQLKKLFIDFQDMFAKDSYDCGVTDLHVARIQTDPNAPPVYVKQYRLPLAAYESLAEIVKNLEARGIIRPVHSSFNSPILAILKPNGQFRLCTDLRQLNKRGYWTIKVDERDQYKLAFSFGDKQRAWQRLPFGYVNSGHEFTVFMHKAMPDAAERGTLIYVDDILIKKRDF
ncbi:uncharacterized protein PAF06_000527 [Gastrophryne carolinensis]